MLLLLLNRFILGISVLFAGFTPYQFLCRIFNFCTHLAIYTLKLNNVLFYIFFSRFFLFSNLIFNRFYLSTIYLLSHSWKPPSQHVYSYVQCVAFYNTNSTNVLFEILKIKPVQNAKMYFVFKTRKMNVILIFKYSLVWNCLINWHQFEIKRWNDFCSYATYLHHLIRGFLFVFQVENRIEKEKRE